MPKNHKKNLTRSLAAGLAVCAIAPGTALAMPAIAGPPVPGSNAVGSSSHPGPPAAPTGGSGVTAQDYRSLDYRAPNQTRSRGDGEAKEALSSDQTDGRATGATAAPGPPQWPVNPQPITRPHSVATTKPSNDDGVNAVIWIALGAAALVVAGGIGFAGGQRLGTGRRHQPA
jgi:hypothetical protein